MEVERQAETMASCVAKLAALYVRCSTKQQVADHNGSTEAQHGQARFAQRRGWPQHLIQVFEDVGTSGSSSNRPAYQNLLALIGGGGVGAVFIADISRVTRDTEELLTFLKHCRTHGVLVVVGGREYDVRRRQGRALEVQPNELRHRGNRITPDRGRRKGPAHEEEHDGR
jgi:DNA invertase Pin-like site-specific DNA recombinase